ncbi:hypothetical protein L0657_19830 [Dyadobacter sp. CY345]|uniref:hypothetical protein n=1 Tax=Dyadobacter sp. CY345 TaxID=2909335 RepID=UPI001F181409|nr:hypothetical protein [Dyadobacter sp. CY345]MCF2446217.1 hypothetical protein [Dyadobacter sp. CY345]
MLTKAKIVEWKNAYDSLKYPISVYDELVVEGTNHPSKFSILGAWKTGCVKEGNIDSVYSDNNGINYYLSKRWAHHTPVGKDTWEFISENQLKIKDTVPPDFPSKKPQVLFELQQRDGFGYIWGLFTLHCCYPQTYPLFDQHVYRAFKYLTTKGKALPVLAPDNWDEYSTYKQFFMSLLEEYQMEYSELDRALWTYGKYLKQNIDIQPVNNPKTSPKKLSMLNFNTDELFQNFTLGGKVKPFWWKMDEQDNIHIFRRFNDGNNLEHTTYSSNLIDGVQLKMFLRDWVPLDNNVSKLYKGTDKEGLGSFVFLLTGNRTGTFIQVTSQLAALFTVANIWMHNSRQTGMKFSAVRDIEWRNLIKDYIRYRNEPEDLNLEVD